MQPATRAALTFSTVVLAVIAIAGAVNTYFFDPYDHAFGRWGTFESYTEVAVACDLIAFFGASIGLRLGAKTGRIPPAMFAILLGVGFALSTLLVLQLIRGGTNFGLLLTGLWLLIGAGVFAYLGCRIYRF
jgi:hypothetical protein